MAIHHLLHPDPIPISPLALPLRHPQHLLQEQPVLRLRPSLRSLAPPPHPDLPSSPVLPLLLPLRRRLLSHHRPQLQLLQNPQARVELHISSAILPYQPSFGGFRVWLSSSSSVGSVASGISLTSSSVWLWRSTIRISRFSWTGSSRLRPLISLKPVDGGPISEKLKWATKNLRYVTVLPSSHSCIETWFRKLFEP